MEIKKQWENMIKGKPIDKKVIKPIVYDSWIRSREYEIDPYKNLSEIVPPDNVLIEELTYCDDLIAEYGEIIEVIRKMAGEIGLICRITDKDAVTTKIIASPRIIKENIRKGNYFAMDASEKSIGTNAICLAIKEDKPVQISGPEHYNYYFHKINCSAAPIHSTKGEVIGVVNISTDSTKETNIQTLGFAISIAKVFDDRRYINKMLEDLRGRNATLSKIMEFLPQGLAYINEDKELESYNNKLLEMLKIKRNESQDEDEIKNKAYNTLIKTECVNNGREANNEEILINTKRKKESFLISNKKVITEENKQKGNIIILEKTDSIIKLHESLRGNKAIYTFEDIIGEKESFKETKDLARKVATSSSEIIIYGESGTGKELFAQAIHNESNRSPKPFIGINCGAIPSELIESELFGYETGAFTGALKGGKPGKLEIASGGTVFLDEIESMPLNVQIKLLRVLSLKKLVKVGGNEEIPIDIRLISATKKDLLKEVEKGNFREDLYYRLNVITLKLPPLKERKEDIPLLVKNLIKLNNIEIHSSFYEALKKYNWRGNIRELKNVVERALLLLDDKKILTADYLPDYIKKAKLYRSMEYKIKESKNEFKKGSKKSLLKTAEEIVIKITLKENKGNLSRTALDLGIARSTLYEKIKTNEELLNVLKSYKN